MATIYWGATLRRIPDEGASSSLSSGETQGGVAFQGQLGAIGVGWGALAIRDDPLPPPNPNLLGGDWPVVGEAGCNIASSMSLARHRREKNLNKPVSSWETRQIQKQCAKLGDEIKQILFNSLEKQFELEINELDESIFTITHGVRLGRDGSRLLRRLSYKGKNILRRVLMYRGPPPPLLRSFVEVARVDGMAKREQGQRPWKRRQEDWMEEDDLLDEVVRHEQDLREGYNYDRGGFGERDFGRGDQGLRGVDLGPQAGRGFSRGQLRGEILKEGIELQEMIMAEKGHMAAECSEKHQIKLFGFGIPNSGFYSMEILDLQVKQSQAMGMVLVHQGDASEAKLNEELKLVVNDRWDFQARQMTSSEYMVVFLDKGTLETFSKIAYLELPIYKLKVKISKSSLDLATFSVLKTCWVQISNVLGVAREFMAEGNFGKSQEFKGGPSGGGKKDDKLDKRDPKDHDDPKGKKKLNKFDRMGRPGILLQICYKNALMSIQIRLLKLILNRSLDALDDEIIQQSWVSSVKKTKGKKKGGGKVGSPTSGASPRAASMMPGATRRPAAGSWKPSTSNADARITGDARKKKAAAVLDMGDE
ncbi:unnamed protein product [Miscanthus lutarioriparius]|uniref:Uncharacterized protein n=1 Tax=Miscanthus lutarioriparius TaxID=422564 RepID=A0A811PG23_9POAL|nr:unnamed protein product [Miscanthus lutarioriparius]